MDFNDTSTAATTDTTTFERVTDDTPPPAPPTMAESLDALVASKAEPAVVTPAAVDTTPAVDPALATTQADGSQVVAPTADTVVPPPAPIAPEPETPSYLSRFSELAAEPLTDALPKAIEVIKEYAAYDPPAEDLLFRTVYAANREDIHRIALGEMGVTKDEVQAFNQWVAAGKQALTMPEAPPAFPEPDATGLVTLPSGAQLDLNIPEDREVYDNSKFRYEYAIQQREQAAIIAKADADQKEQARKTEAQREQQVIAERRSTYANNRMSVIADTIKANLNLAPEDAWMTEMVSAYAYSQVDTDDALGKLAEAADPYVVQGAGRAADYAKDIDNKIRAITNSTLDKFNTMFLRGKAAETKLYNREPVLPAGTKTVGGQSVQAKVDDTIPVGSADDIIRQQLAAMSNSFQQ